MRYKIIILMFTLSFLSSQSIFNRWNGSNPFVGSARSTAMGETHLLNSSGSSKVRFNPSRIGDLGSKIGINFQINSTSIFERWSMPVRDSFGEFLTNADYVANEYKYYNISGGMFGSINFSKIGLVGIGIYHSPLTNFTYQYSEEVRGSYSIEDGEYASKDPIVGYQNININGQLVLTSIGSSIKLISIPISFGFANNIILSSTLKDKVEVDTLYANVTNLSEFPDVNLNYDTPSSNFITLSSDIDLNPQINIGFSFEESTIITTNDAQVTIDSSSGLYLFWDKKAFGVTGLNYIKPEIQSFAISYNSKHEKEMSIDFEVNKVLYQQHLNLLDTKYYKFGFEYITGMGTPIRAGLIYKQVPIAKLDPISIFTFGTGKNINDFIIDLSGTYCFQSFNYPDLFTVEGDIRSENDLIRDSQIHLQLGITYLY